MSITTDELGVVLDMLKGAGRQDDGRAFFSVHEGEPVPQERARGGRHYTPKRTRGAQDALIKHFEKVLTPWGTFPLEGNLAFVCIFYRSTRRVVDGDNLMKLVLDAGTKAKLWRDDSQITGGGFRIELDRLNPRTIIAIAPQESSLRRDLVRVK